MRIITYIGCAATLAGLSQYGCGSKPAPAASSQAPAAVEKSSPTVPLQDDRPIIVAFGDSLTAGFGAEPGKSYPDYLQHEIDDAGVHWLVVNEGVSGDTTTDGLNRVAEVLALHPKIVIVELGGNDGLRGLPLESTRTNLQGIIEQVQSAGPKVVLAGMTLPPNYGPDYIQSFQKIYADLAGKYHVRLLPFLLTGVGGNAKLMQRDGLHPTAEGNRIVGRYVFSFVKPMLKK